jgi:8-oxo-dGTP diphosphatase
MRRKMVSLIGGSGNIVERVTLWRDMQREFPDAPLFGVGAVIIESDCDPPRVLLVRRGREPLKGHWSIPGGLLELGESLLDAVVREVREETGLTVEPLELVELLDRIHREGAQVRYHYVIADYLCRVKNPGEDSCLQAGSDAAEVRWVGRAEWMGDNSLEIDAITIRVIEAGWQRARALQAEGRWHG